MSAFTPDKTVDREYFSGFRVVEGKFNMSSKPNGSPLKEVACVEHIDGLFSYALVLTRNRSDAEDLVQEAYVRAIGAMKMLRSDSNVKSWLFTILRNVWLNQLRQRRSAPSMIDAPMDEIATDLRGQSADDPHTLFVSQIERQQVRDAIQQLPVDFREIILLREFEDLSYQEIATVLDCPAGTVMSRLARARSRLRTLLSATLSNSTSRIREN
jgi:RNA polymerase sigma-70 factor (ECF subfamily)